MIIDDAQRKLHWRRTLRLMAAMLAILALLAILAPLLSPYLNVYRFLRFPLGYFLVAHGAIIGIIAAVYWFIARQANLDRRHNITSEF